MFGLETGGYSAQFDVGGGFPSIEGVDMLVHLYKSTRSAIHCATAQRDEAVLPQMLDHGEWIYVKDIMIAPGEQRLAIDYDEAIEDISKDGYHLLSGWYQQH